MKQLTLDLHADAPPLLENFVAAANADLLAALYEAVPVADVPQHLFLWGDAGSGRSHLLKSVVSAAAQAGRPLRRRGQRTMLTRGCEVSSR